MFSLAAPRGHLQALNFLLVYLLSLTLSHNERCTNEHYTQRHKKIKRICLSKCSAQNLVKVSDEAL